MGSALISTLVSLWKSWASFFVFIPYGDPYLAIGAFLIALTIIARLSWLFWQYLSKEVEMTPEMERLKMYRKVLNLR